MFVVRFFVIFSVITVSMGCAPHMTPLQERAWSAFTECQKLAPTARLTQLLPDGTFGFETREGDYQIMIRCLEERYGYKF